MYSGHSSKEKALSHISSYNENFLVLNLIATRRSSLTPSVLKLT